MAEPNEQHLRVLRNIEASRDFQEGFLIQQNAVQAMFQCVLNGWVSRNRLTKEGRALLAAQKPLKGDFEITIVKEEKVIHLLPPSSLFNPKDPE